VSGLTLYRLSADANTLVSLRPGKPNLPVHETDPTTPPPTSAPVLSRTGLTHNTATLAWTSVPGATGYELRRKGVPVYSGPDLSRTDTGLNPLTDYEWQVAGFNDGGFGPWSNLVAETTPAEPVTPPAGDRFAYTTAQVDEFRQRMSGAGPFYSTGQGFYGSQANAPGDGVRALNRANDFLANPTASRYTLTVPMVLNSTYPGDGETGTTLERHIRFMSAAWCYMTMPDHPNRTAWGEAAKAQLLWVATRSQHNFENETNYSTDFPGYAASPIFAIAGWVRRHLKTYDMLGRGFFTTSERATLDRWFYGWANFIFRWLIRKHNSLARFPGKLNGDYTLASGSDVSGPQPSNQVPPYDGGPTTVPVVAEMHTNRHGQCANTAGNIANYLKRYDYVAPTSGIASQYLTVDQLLTHARAYAGEWITHSVSALGFLGDYHRGPLGSNSTLGWRYACQEMAGAMGIAEAFALRGDMSVFNFQTTGGLTPMSGTPIAGGYTHKSFQWAGYLHARYHIVGTGGWGRTLFGNNLAPSNDIRPFIECAILDHYYPSSWFRSGWTRVGNNFPGYPASPYSVGRWNALDGDIATSIGIIEYGGV
jgi:hypothetical protein